MAFVTALSDPDEGVALLAFEVLQKQQTAEWLIPHLERALMASQVLKLQSGIVSYLVHHAEVIPDSLIPVFREMLQTPGLQSNAGASSFYLL